MLPNKNDMSQLATIAFATLTTTGLILSSTNENDASAMHHFSTITTRCEMSSKGRPPTTDTPNIKFSKMGVNREDVDALVRVIMKDPSVNMTMLPDPLEAQLYKSTILLTLNAIYSLLGLLDGVHILSHELTLSIERDDPTSQQQQDPPLNVIQPFFDGTIQGVNDDVLRTVAQRLLMNPAVNSPWIPDALEEQIYTSCLQVVFRVIQIVLATFKIEICGHDLTLQLASSPERLESAILAAATSSGNGEYHHRITPIDLELLQSMAKRSGVDDTTHPDSSLWKRLFTRSDFVQQLHISLYGLILGILDDLFSGHLRVQVLSDDVVFDLVPSSKKKIPSKPKNDSDTAATAVGKQEENERTKECSSIPSPLSTKGPSANLLGVAFSSFVAGIAIGMTVMTFSQSVR